MTGKYSEKTEKAEHYKAPQKAAHYETEEKPGNYENTGSGFGGKKIILIIILTAVITAALTTGAFLLINNFMNGSSSSQNTASSADKTSSAASAVSGETGDGSAAQQSVAETAEQGYTSAESSESGGDIVVPTISGEEQGEKFSATLTPYLAKDTGSGQEMTLQEVFGSSYSGGGMTFNEDGTFTDGVTASSANSGAYIVEGDTVIATYSNDKNMIASVLEWDGTTPVEIKITFGEVDVYFK